MSLPCAVTQFLPSKQSEVSELSLLLLILSTSRDGGSAGILLRWLSSRFSLFRKVKFYITHSKKRGEQARMNRQNGYFSKSIIFHPDSPSRIQSQSSQKYTKWGNDKFVHFFHVIYHVVFLVKPLCVAPHWKLLWLMCVKWNSGLDPLQYPSSQSISPLSLLGCEQKIKNKKSSKNNFFLFSTSLAAAVFQQVYPANTVRVCWKWCVMIGQSVVGCFSVVRICVWSVDILRLDQRLFLERIS